MRRCVVHACVCVLGWKRLHIVQRVWNSKMEIMLIVS